MNKKRKKRSDREEKKNPKLELEKSRRVLIDVYIRMRTLDPRLLKFATAADAEQQLQRLKKIKNVQEKYKSYGHGARAKVMGKTQVVAIAKRAKEQLKKAHRVVDIR